MPSDQPTPPPSRPGRSEPWRVERMVQRVPAHLGETTPESVSPWVMLAGVVLLLVVACIILFIVLNNGGFGFGAPVAATATPTRAPRQATPIVTVIPATLAPPTFTPLPTVPPVKYKVKSGDSLIAIAAKYKVSVQAIMTANNLKDETIRIGEELIIPLPTPTPPPNANPPAAPGTTPTPISYQPPPSPADASTPGVLRYTVKNGDTLSSIAAANGSTPDAIRIASQLDSDFLSIGQVLLVPLGAWTPPATLAPVMVASPLPTAQFAYAAPNLMSPSDKQAFRGKADLPKLEWISPGILKPNEIYVVHLDYTVNGEKKSIVRQEKQGTSVTLKATDYPGANTSGTEFSWYVMVVSQPTTASKVPAQNPQTSASSPPSDSRTFRWY